MIFDMLKVTFGCFIDFSHSSADLCKSDAQRRLCISRVEASRQDWFTFKPRLESKSSRGLAPSKLSEVLNVVSVLSLVRLFVLKPSGFLKPLAVISHFLKSHTHTDTHKDINKSFNFQIFSFFLNLWILCVHFYWRSLCFVFCFFFCKRSPNLWCSRWSNCRDESSIFFNFILWDKYLSRQSEQRQRHDFDALRGGKCSTPVVYPPFFKFAQL